MNPTSPTPKPDDKKKALQILVPALAVAGVVLLIGLMVSIGSSPAPTNPGKGKPGETAKFDRFPLDGPEWKSLDEGLKIWDVKEGTGEACPETATVNVHYTGWLTDGTQFDSSRDRGKPIEFGLDQVIRGWTKGIPGMKAGTVRRLYIPWAIAYGASGRGQIPPKADLIFEVEMLGFR